jgi:hypothetical protein
MSTSYGALCTDFYLNQKLAVKMDLPAERETILHFFDQVKKTRPGMNRFRRYEGELALESPRKEAAYQWLAIRRSSIRTGSVNPATMQEAFDLHTMVLQQAPFHLTVSPLDVDHLELTLGFDLECERDHDDVVYEALYGPRPIVDLAGIPDARPLDVQPVFGVSLSDNGDTQAYFEVKTRHRTRRGKSARYQHEPISIFLTLRRYGPLDNLKQLPIWLKTLAGHAETLTNERLVPDLLQPISRLITSGSA